MLKQFTLMEELLLRSLGFTPPTSKYFYGYHAMWKALDGRAISGNGGSDTPVYTTQRSPTAVQLVCFSIEEALSTLGFLHDAKQVRPN